MKALSARLAALAAILLAGAGDLAAHHELADPADIFDKMGPTPRDGHVHSGPVGRAGHSPDPHHHYRASLLVPAFKGVLKARMKADLRIDGGTLVLPEMGVVRAGLAVRDGKIAAIGDEGALPPARKRIDASGLHVLPGLVDPHGHMGMNDDFAGECATETRAALKGGVTTIGLFIRTPGDYLDDIPDLAALVGRTAFIDVFFTLNISDAEQVGNIPRYAKQLGIHSYKFYMWSVPGGKPMDDALLFRGFRQVTKLGRAGLACVHAETKSLVDEATERVAGLPSWKGSHLKRYTASHPPLAEALAIETAAHLAAAADVRLYIVHLSSRDGLETAGRLKSFMPNLIVETTPHHLNLTEEHDAGMFAKIAPPVRDKSHPEALWKGLIEGGSTRSARTTCPGGGRRRSITGAMPSPGSRATARSSP